MSNLRLSLSRKILRVEIGSWIATLLTGFLLGCWLWHDYRQAIAIPQHRIPWVWLGLILTSFYLSAWSSRYRRQQHNRDSHWSSGSELWLTFFLTAGLAQTLWSLDLPHGVLMYQVSGLWIAAGLNKEYPKLSQSLNLGRLFVLFNVLISLLFGLIPIPVFFQSEAFAALLAVLAVPLTLIFVTAFLDFYSFMNGADGLVASTVIIQAAFFALYLEQPLFVLLSVTLIGFLLWNWFPAQVQLNALQSNVLGLTMAVTLLNGQPGNHWQTSPTLFWSAIAITFPLMGDATYTAIRRLLRREHFFRVPASQRFHIYQRLQQVGWTDDKITLLYSGLTGIIAILVMQFDLWGSAIAALLTLGCIAGAEVYLHGSGKFNPQA